MDKKRLKSLAISLILLIFSVSFVIATVDIAKKGKRLIGAKRELEVLQQQKEELRKELEYRKSAEFIEEEARNKLNMVKPGEEVYLRPKITGDDLLGGQDGPRNGSGNDFRDRPPRKPPWFFVSIFDPVTARVHHWFDNVKDFLLLFQS